MDYSFIIAKPLNRNEKQELVSSLRRGVSRFTEQKNRDAATYSLAQANEEKNQACLKLDKKLKIIEDLLITVQDPTQRAKLFIDQEKTQRQKTKRWYTARILGN